MAVPRRHDTDHDSGHDTGSDSGRNTKERKLEPEIIAGLALAATLFGFITLAAALAAGGNVPMIGLGLVVTALSMDLFRIANARTEK